MDYQMTQAICFRLGKTMRKVNKYYDKNLQTHNITFTQLFILAALLEKEPIRFKELADLVNIEGSTLSGIIDRMERKDLVQRREDHEDRRSLLLGLTDKAREIGPELLQTAHRLEDDLKAKLSDGEYLLFLEILDKIADL